MKQYQLMVFSSNVYLPNMQTRVTVLFSELSHGAAGDGRLSGLC